MTPEAHERRVALCADVEKQVRGAWRVVGAHLGDEQVGFCRAVSDGVALAYLADVYVVPAQRGHGLGERLVRARLTDGPGAGFRWLLHTADAHDLYRKVGFREPDATAARAAARDHQERLRSSGRNRARCDEVDVVGP